MGSPAAEVGIDAALVRRLLHEQHPDLAGLALCRLDAGWDNGLWRLGDDLLVRLPRREVAAALTAHELLWVPELAPTLPLPVPVPLRAGRPGCGYPWSWAVLPWIEGTPGDRAPLADAMATARRLGGFLRALHRPAPADAPRSAWRGVPLATRAPTFDERADRLGGRVDREGLEAVWAAALAAPTHRGASRWLHGDLHPANTLVHAGELVAVIDFGDVCAGDPATDVAAAWMLLPTEAHHDFADAYGGLDDGLVARALGWAVLFGLMLLEIGLDDKPTYATVARATLGRAVSSLRGRS